MNYTNMFPSNSEFWLSIDGYLNYEVSWFGRVRNATTGRILKPTENRGGYLYVNLSKTEINSAQKSRKVTLNIGQLN